MDVLLTLVVVFLVLNLMVLVARRKPDGEMVVQELEDGRKTFSLELEGDPQELSSKKTITFKVINKL